MIIREQVVFLITTVLMLTLAGIGKAAATTYYVSKSTGADSNTATQAKSKATPWAHIPGMAGATANVAAYTPAAGDTFILMGCDVWVNADLPVSWNWSGSAGNPITVTADKTWYNTSNCPSGWNRPVWDAGNSAVSGGAMLCVSCSADTHDGVFDNIEMKRMLFGSSGGQFIWMRQVVNRYTFSNFYIHAWNSTADNCIIVQGSAGNTFTNGIIDGSDGTGAAAGHSCYGFYPTPPNVINSVVHDLPNPIVGYAGGYSGVTTLTISGNNFYNASDSYQGQNHCNIMEIVGGGTYYIYNNLLHDLECAGGEAMMVGNGGENSYIFNNVIYNLGAGQPPQMPQTAGQAGISMRFYNNTVVSNGQSCFTYSGQPGYSFNTLVFENNHCITPGGSAIDSALISAGGVATTNLLQSPTAANANGSPHFDQYNSTETYAYSTVASTNSTVGAGTNLTGTCTGGLAPLCTDTSYACTQQTVSGVVQAVCAKRAATARGSIGAWDVGAYQYVVGGPPPNPPLGLTAVVS